MRLPPAIAVGVRERMSHGDRDALCRATAQVPVPVVSTPGPEVARTLSVTASYLLSEDGRKASLLAGGDGHAVQQITLQVPANRLHLVSVDKQGVARLKLQTAVRDETANAASSGSTPRPSTTRRRRSTSCIGPPRRITNWNAPTMPSASPQQIEADVRPIATFARASPRRFLGDKAQRAVAHPPPSPKQLLHRHGARSPALRRRARTKDCAKDVPPEAHRRFRADLRVRDERNRQDRAAQLALHEEKKRFIADWVAAHGTDEQKARQAAGVLPMDEAIEAMTDQAFAARWSPAAIHARWRGAPAGGPSLHPASRRSRVVSRRRDSSQRQRGDGDGRAVGGCSGDPSR